MRLLPLLWLPLLAAPAAAQTPAGSQTRSALTYDAGAAQVKYVVNQRIELDDTPGHTLRLYDLRRTFTRRPPVFEGVRATQMWERGIADVIEHNGTERGYVTYVLEDGNRIFARYDAATSSFRWPDGTRHHDTSGAIVITGGTGVFAGIRGTVAVRSAVDPGADSTQIESKGEYWLER